MVDDGGGPGEQRLHRRVDALDISVNHLRLDFGECDSRLGGIDARLGRGAIHCLAVPAVEGGILADREGKLQSQLFKRSRHPR